MKLSMRIARSGYRLRVLGIVAAAGLAHCNGSGSAAYDGAGQQGHGSGSSGSSGGLNNGSGSGGSGASSGAASGSSSGAGSSSGGSSGGTSAAAIDSGSTGDDASGASDASSASGATADAGSGDASPVEAGPPLKDCKSGDTGPCGTFTTSPSSKLTMGPYGAQMDVNVGKGFENAIQSGDMANSPTCQSFVSLFAEDPKVSAQLLDTMQSGVSLDFSLYTVYRPAVWPSGPIPVITWGNGTCAQPEGYGGLLRDVASYGYFVVAANSRWVGSGTPAPMLHALDFATAANADSTSPYYQKLDLTKIGAMGHSQGGSATASAANDSRVKDVIIFNAVDSGVAKPYLTTSGDLDVTNFTAQSMASAVNLSSQPAAYLYYHNPAGMGSARGHLVLMMTPERVTGPTVGWWQMMFRNDATSRALFVGSSCGLCGNAADYDYGEHGL